jgi:hypothetical protein
MKPLRTLETLGFWVSPTKGEVKMASEKSSIQASKHSDLDGVTLSKFLRRAPLAAQTCDQQTPLLSWMQLRVYATFGFPGIDEHPLWVWAIHSEFANPAAES